jgi:hypothetical protein
MEDPVGRDQADPAGSSGGRVAFAFAYVLLNVHTPSGPAPAICAGIVPWGRAVAVSVACPLALISPSCDCVVTNHICPSAPAKI